MQNLNERVTIKETQEQGTVISRVHGYITVQVDNGPTRILHEAEVSKQQFLSEIENDGQNLL